MMMTTGRLGGRDVAATLVVLAAFGLYAWHLAAPGTAFIGSTRWIAVAGLVLGAIGCSMAGPDAIRQTPAKWIGGVLGSIALVAAVVTLIAGSPIALAVYMAAFGLLWAATTVQHAVGGAATGRRPGTAA